MRISRLQFVSVPVSDQAKSRDFYLDVLGFELVVDVAGPHGRFLMVAPPGSPSGVVLVDFPVGGLELSGPVHLQFHTDDVDADVAELRAAGVQAGDVQEMPWGRATSFTDPDGNVLSLLQPSRMGDRPAAP
ncbi:VOC family protein [Saccharopolyspora hirsuta]|uniref:Glyoxalase n=1 Tax=Saccharopolyspora hirsuta TaxID=1837 RepID=A0A5M7BYQ7_SACHI|nr:VOC family protein [Saccharopolyspora hirsuta]KAA5834290.1 glyoxalase [Saccharopolyspora hirsuta]